MIDLVEFLRARYAEAGALARVIVDGDHWHGIHVDTATEVAVHIERHDPARVLREVERDRRIIDLCVAEIENGTDGAATAESVLYLLATPHADHPDYREEWRLSASG